jgi:DNA-binding MarR family transcriptional regulator
VGDRLPLPTLLSFALVAYTIEFDNEAEHQLPHRTTRHGPTAGSGAKPWLASLAMWSNCMKFIGPDGVQLGDLERLARTRTNLDGMRRWGYIAITPGPNDRDPKRPGRDAIIGVTAAGRRAQEIWGPLFGVIGGRWRERFGDDAIEGMRAALSAIVDRIDLDLPDCLPILGYGLFSSGPDAFHPRKDDDADANLPLSALLSRVLLAYAIDFERDSKVSLAVSANVLRVLTDDGVRVRDLPMRIGISKEAVAMSAKYLEAVGCVTIEPVPAPDRGQRLRLTAKGRAAQQYAGQLSRTIETDWQTRFGTDAVRSIRSALEPLVDDGTAGSPLFAGFQPYPDGWRAAIPRPATLPHYPMVLHRGGYPDGS